MATMRSSSPALNASRHCCRRFCAGSSNVIGGRPSPFAFAFFRGFAGRLQHGMFEPRASQTCVFTMTTAGRGRSARQLAQHPLEGGGLLVGVRRKLEETRRAARAGSWPSRQCSKKPGPVAGSAPLYHACCASAPPGAEGGAQRLRHLEVVQELKVLVAHGVARARRDRAAQRRDRDRLAILQAPQHAAELAAPPSASSQESSRLA